MASSHLVGTDSSSPPSDSICLNATEAASLLRISERTLHTLTRACKVPHLKAQRRVLYSRRALEQWAEQQSALSQVSG